MTSRGPTGYANPSATWGPAGELLTFGSQFQGYCCNAPVWPGISETRTYNPLGQLTRITATSWSGPTLMDVQYLYTSGQNNGRISQMADGVTGEQVSYTYDALNRLAGAQTADSLWGEQYRYDGWGNLVVKAVTKGTAPVYSQMFDPSLNRPVGTAPPTAAVDPGGLDYAVQPYYNSAMGSFTAPDPSYANVDLENPTSWNRFPYANGDPINFNDPEAKNAMSPDSGGSGLCWGTAVYVDGMYYGCTGCVGGMPGGGGGPLCQHD